MKIKLILTFILLAGIFLRLNAQSLRQEELFDDNWKFHLGDIKDAEKPTFNDKSWRNIDIPHDWSIEKLSGQEPGKVVGPFSKESIGTTATGYTVGGTGWYRKTFTLGKNKFYSTLINFDGVYMNCEVWVNGKKVGWHPYGYTAFHFDISKYLNAPGKPNILPVSIRVSPFATLLADTDTFTAFAPVYFAASSKETLVLVLFS
jgi:beta-galactosidase